MDIINTIGRRKSSVARIYMKPGKGNIVINDKDVKTFFPTSLLQFKIHQPFNLTSTDKKFDVTVNVKGGGITGQAGAIRLGISRALGKLSEDDRVKLRGAGFLTRDARKVERKKPGLRKARKRDQFSKR